jgi:hypothetical protein
MIMRRRAFGKGPEPAQQGQLRLPEAGDVGDRLGAGQHSQQAQKQHFRQGVHHLGALPRVRQIPKIAQKNNRLPRLRRGGCPATSTGLPSILRGDSFGQVLR